MSNEPEIKIIKQMEDKVYIGNFVFYKDQDIGCAFIIEIPTVSNRVFMGKSVKTWEGVSREEGWKLINEWIEQTNN